VTIFVRRIQIEYIDEIGFQEDCSFLCNGREGKYFRKEDICF
jgi:hypothetical protein